MRRNQSLQQAGGHRGAFGHHGESVARAGQASADDCEAAPETARAPAAASLAEATSQVIVTQTSGRLNLSLFHNQL